MMVKDQRNRMALTISDELRAAIYELGDALKKPPATALVDMLGDMIPTIRMNAQMIQAARSGDTVKVQAILREMVGETASQMMLASLPKEPKPRGRPRKNQGENNGND